MNNKKHVILISIPARKHLNCTVFFSYSSGCFCVKYLTKNNVWPSPPGSANYNCAKR